MKKSDIENQLTSAETALKEAIQRFEEAKRAVEEMIAKTQVLVVERTTSFNQAREEKNCANSLASSLNENFQNAKSKLDRKVAEHTCTLNKIVFLRNNYMNYQSKYMAAHAETAHLEAMLSCPGYSQEQKRNFSAQLQMSRAAEAHYHSLMEKYFNEMCRQSSRLPKIEQEVKEFERLTNEIRPKLELANNHLEEAKEKERRADELLHEAMAVMDRNKELGQLKLNEATAERERSRELVEYWKRTLYSAQTLLIDYISKQYD